MGALNKPCYKYFRLFSNLAGFWLIEDSKKQKTRRFLFYLCMFPYSLMQLTVIIPTKENFEGALSSLPLILSAIIVSIKYATISLQLNLLYEFLKRIEGNWKLLQSDEEQALMENYSNFGDTYGKIHAISTYFLSISGCSILSTLREFQKYFLPPEHFHKTGFCYLMNMVDSHTSTVATYIYLELFAMYTATVMASADFVYITIVFHGCGMLDVLGHRYEHFFDNIQHLNPQQKRSVLRNRMRDAIRYHFKYIELESMLDTCYTFPMSVQLSMIILLYGTKLYNVYKFLESNYFLVLFIICDAVYNYLLVFLICIPAEMLADGNRNLYFKVYSGHWYDAPCKIQKMLPFMMSRITEPFYFTLLGIFKVSFETCSKVLQISFSFFTMISTIR